LGYPEVAARRWAVCLAVPGKIIEIREDDLRTGRVSFGQVVKDVSLVFVPKAAVGDYVMIHAGMALEVIDEKAANHVFEALKELEEEGLTGDGWA
jgi:hydrogenase expression/formation protein HypC